MADVKAKKKKRDANKKRKREAKDAIRRVFLGRLPKGKVAVEIGVWHGEFSATILEYIQPKKLYLIDPWEKVSNDSHVNAFVGRTDDGQMERIYKNVQKKYKAEIKAKQVKIVRDWSANALAKFKNESIDFAYVDGDHSYEGVKADIKALFPKMQIGGIMAFDDYHRRGWWGDGVIRAINEFLGMYPQHFRIRAVAGAQIAIEKIEPTPK